MISIYGDESHDSMKQRAFAVAGLLGNSKQWDKLNTLWAGRTLGKTFHAADCESGYGDFRGFAPHERVRLHMDLTGILADSGLIGWGLGIDVASCKRAFPKMPRAQIYCSAFLRCLDFLLDEAHSRKPAEPIDVVFDQHRETKYNFELLFKYAREEGEWKEQGLLNQNIRFATRAEIGIQAADLWARELMKFLDGTLFGENYGPRPQWTTF